MNSHNEQISPAENAVEENVPELQIIIPTFNRLECLKETFNQVLAEKSPVRDVPILVLDNASTDGTASFLDCLSSEHTNVRVIHRRRNVGGNGNIARALEEATGKYLWIMGDDDYFDFSNWDEVRDAMRRDEDAICLSRYVLPDEHRDDVAWQMLQMTFITGTILKTSLLTDTVLFEAYNHIHTLFPQMIPLFHLINRGGGGICGKQGRRIQWRRRKSRKEGCQLYSRHKAFGCFPVYIKYRVDSRLGDGVRNIKRSRNKRAHIYAWTPIYL